MMKKNRFIILLLTFLMITWFTPAIFRDNIASAYIYSNYDMKLISQRFDTGYGIGATIHMYNDIATSPNGKYVYTTTDAYSGGVYIGETCGLMVYNATSHNLITHANETNISYDRIWVNGNYIFLTRDKGICAYYFSYATLTLSLLDEINTTGYNNASDITGYSSYIFTAGRNGSYKLMAYSFDYGGTNTFTWLASYNDSQMAFITTDGTYIYTVGYNILDTLWALSFSGGAFTLIDNATTTPHSGGWDIYLDNSTGYIYFAGAGAGFYVFSFNGITLNLEYARNDGWVTSITGNDTMIYTGAFPFQTVSVYTKFILSMTLLTTFTIPDVSHIVGLVSPNVEGLFAYQKYCYVASLVGFITLELIPYIPPTVSTDGATSVTTTTATLNGHIIDNGGWDFTTYGFQYGLTGAYELGYLQSTNVQETLSKISNINDDTYTDIMGDGVGNIFTTCAGNGLRAYVYNGTGWLLKDTIDDGGTYNGLYAFNSWHVWTPFSNTILFVACGGDGLRAYKYNSSGFTLITTIDDGGTYNSVWYVDPTHIYVACGASGIRCYSFNGATYTLLSTRFDGTQPYLDVCADSNGEYACCGTEGLRAYTYAGGVFTPHGSSYAGTSTYDRCYPKQIYTPTWGYLKYIFVARHSDGLLSYTFDGASLTPRTVKLDGTGAYRDVWSDGTYIYTACSADGLRAYLYNGLTFTLRATKYDGTGSDYNTVWSDNESNIFTASDSDGIFSYHRINNGSYTYPLAGLIPGSIYHIRAFTNNSHETGYGIDYLLYTGSSGGVYLDLNLNVYNESNGSQGIPFNIMIKNLAGTQIYSLLNQHNTLHLNTTTISGNQTVLIKVWSANYRERIINVHVGNHLTANYTFYLPREELNPGTDPGGGSSFYPYSNITSTNYEVRVVYTIKSDYSEFDRPIRDAWVNITRFINATGRYETMSVLLTDTNGFANVYLIPSVLYLFNVSAPSFVTLTADWNPPPVNIYQTPELKIFRLVKIPISQQTLNYTFFMDNISWSLTPTTTEYTGPIPFSFHIRSYNGRLQWFRMTVEYLNISNHTWVTLFSGNSTTATGGYLNYTTANITGNYRVELYFKKIGYPEYKLFQLGSLHYTIIFIKQFIRQIPSFVWYLVIIVIMIMVMGYCFTRLGTGLLTGYIGLFVFAFGLLLKPGLTINGFSGWGIFALTFLLYTMGVFLWSRV